MCSAAVVEGVPGVGVDVHRSHDLPVGEQRERQHAVHPQSAGPGTEPGPPGVAAEGPGPHGSPGRGGADTRVLRRCRTGCRRFPGRRARFSRWCRTRSASIRVSPAPSAPGMACTAKVATWVSRSSRLNRALDNPANAARLPVSSSPSLGGSTAGWSETSCRYRSMARSFDRRSNTRNEDYPGGSMANQGWRLVR